MTSTSSNLSSHLVAKSLIWYAQRDTWENIFPKMSYNSRVKTFITITWFHANVHVSLVICNTRYIMPVIGWMKICHVNEHARFESTAVWLPYLPIFGPLKDSIEVKGIKLWECVEHGDFFSIIGCRLLVSYRVLFIAVIVWKKITNKVFQSHAYGL